MVAVEEVVRKSLTGQAIEALSAAILDGDLVPDRLYSATELGDLLGVSRTPIREALQVLERRGLVVIERNRGARVTRTSVQSLIEVFQVRLMIEVPLSRRSTQLATEDTRAEFEAAVESFGRAVASQDVDVVLRADRDFHRALMAGARNEKAREILQLQRDFVLATGMGTVPTSRSAEDCFDDHRDIIAAFRASDPDAVAAAVRRHISNTAKMLIRQETRQRPEFGDVDVAAAIDWL